MSQPSDRSRESVSSVVQGLTEEQRQQSLAAFFEAFPWAPSTHAVLSQWSSRTFFDHFVR